MAESVQKINLKTTLQTDTLFSDINAFNNPNARHIQNSGIERDGGIKNLFLISESDSDYDEIFYCSNGNKARLKYDSVNNNYRVFSNAREIGAIPKRGLTLRKLIQADVDDSAISTDGTILTVRMSGSIAVIEELNALTFELIRTKQIATDATTIQCFFVRRKDLTFTTANAVIGIYDVSGKLYFKLFRAGSPIVAIANQGGFNDASQVFAWYDNGYIICSQDPADQRVFLLSSLAVQAGSYTESVFLTAHFDRSANTVSFYGFRNGVTAVIDKNIYGYSFVPPIGMGVWTINQLQDPDILTPTAINYTIGGIAVCYESISSIKKILVSDGPTQVIYEIGHDTPPEIFGLVDKKADFQIKTKTINYSAAYLAATFSADSVGEPITEIGELNGRYAPHIVKQSSGDYWILYRRGDAQYSYIIISETITNRMQEIAPGIVKINTISALSIVDTTDNTLYFSGNGYNGFAIIQFMPTGTNKQFASRFEGKYGNSVDVGDKIAVNVGALVSIIIPEGRVYSPSNEVIDIFVSNNYVTSIKGNVSRINQTQLIGTLYVEDNRIPAPIGSVITQKTFDLLLSTAIREENYDGYQLSNEIPGHYQAFSLFSQLYLFNGEKIFLVTLIFNIISQKIEVANAMGLLLLAVAPTLVYFYSQFDNSIFTFGGGRSVDKSLRLSQKSPVQSGVYNASENTLAIITTTSILWIRDGVITENDIPLMAPLRTFSTKNGIYIAKGGFAVRYSYNQIILTSDTLDGGDYPDIVNGGNYIDIIDGGTLEGSGLILPLVVQTAYFGPDDDRLNSINRFVLRLQSDKKGLETFLITYYSFDQNQTYMQTATFTIGDILNPWDANGYAYITFLPGRPRCLAGSFRIESLARVTLLELCAYQAETDRNIVKNKG